MSFLTISEMFNITCKKWGKSKVCYRYKENGEWKSLNYEELYDKVSAFAIALMELGIHKGDRIGIASENRIEWIIASFAITQLGAIDVPIFPILTAKQEEYIFSHSEVSAIIVSNNFQLKKVLEFKDNIPSLRHVIVMNKDYDRKNLFVRSMTELIERGESIRNSKEREELLTECCDKITEDDLLTIIYTSGTTGEPKGVMLTHKNVASNVTASIKAFGGDLSKERALSYLPFCHAYERTTGFYALFAGGAEVAIAESIDTVATNLKEIQPTFMTTVPKLLEKVKKKIYLAIEKESSIKKKMFHWAVSVGTKYVRNLLKNQVNPFTTTKYNIADKLVFSKLREKLGGQLRRMYSGGAALPIDVAEFFWALGIKVYEGYGLTEASPVVAVGRDNNIELGTIGTPLDGIEVRLADDGEILVRGPNVMKGYWKDELATQEAIDEDGWLYTGDIAIITEKGNLKITDRKKNIFVSSGGKNIAPQPIENLLCQSKYIDQCVLIGERREYCTALLTPNFEQLKQLANDLGLEYQSEDELIVNQKIIKHIKNEIDFYQKDLSKFEKIRKFSLLSKPFSVETGELSPKMSIKRHIVERNYADIIERMYKED